MISYVDNYVSIIFLFSRFKNNYVNLNIIYGFKYYLITCKCENGMKFWFDFIGKLFFLEIEIG